jgi:hypothetical protein
MHARQDWSVARRAIVNGYVLVTNNTTDFTSLLEREEAHPGLVCLNVAPGLMSLDVQKRLFVLALERLGDSEPINEILEVTLRADLTVLVERYLRHSRRCGAQTAVPQCSKAGGCRGWSLAQRHQFCYTVEQ